jgi:hypothetical protein
MMKAGEVAVIEVKAGQFSEVHGMQWTTRLTGLEITGVEGRGIEIDDNNVAMKQGVMTLSWSADRGVSVAQGSEVMRLTVKAATAGRLSEMMKITSEVTRAEAYTGSDMERGSVVLEVRGKEKGEFSVSQNEPNPWRSETVISYELPKAGDVKVTVMDISGKVVKTYNQRGKSGANSITLTREELGGATGVLIYKIESGADAVQRKMIVIE